LAFDFDLEDKAAKGVPEEEFESWLTFHMHREKQWFEVVSHLMKHDPCDLTAILFDGPDKVSHIGWRFLDPALFPAAPSSWERKIRELCIDYFRELDGFLAEIVAIAGPDARIFIASDHGFGPSREVFRVNTWLHDQGYLTWKDTSNLDEKSKASVKRLVERHFVHLDWERTTAYARTLTSNGIYIRVARGPDQTGVPPDQYESFRGELIEKLKAVTDPKTKEPIIKRILTKEEAYPGVCNSQAPDLTLVMRDYSFISILNKSPIIYRRPEVEGTHYPEGVFIAHGPGIQARVTLTPFSILDVAPCLLYSLGMEIPSDFEGRMPDGIFEDAYMINHPYRIGTPTQFSDSFARRAQKEAEKKREEEEIYKRLKMLGYLE
jgi:predicted AlkP superfamily phosphohydrolase/phosphomutase